MSEHERAASQGATPVASGADAEREMVAREIGATLARARQEQRLTVEDVSARLKVPATKLSAIEAGELAALPDVTFTKGVMRAYARVIHADIDALLVRFHPQPAMAVETVRPAGRLNETFDDSRRFVARGSGGGGGAAGGRWIWLALVVIVIGAGAYFGFDRAKQWFAERHAVEQPAADAPGTAPATAGNGESGSGNGTVTAALPPVMSAPDSPAPSEAGPASAPAADKATTVTSSSTLAAPAAAVPATGATPAAASGAAAATAPAAAAPAAGAGELAIRFSADTWYEIRDRSGKVVMGGTGKAGQELSGSGTPPYKVVIGNVKGVASFTRNGQPVDFGGDQRGNVARMTLP